MRTTARSAGCLSRQRVTGSITTNSAAIGTMPLGRAATAAQQARTPAPTSHQRVRTECALPARPSSAMAARVAAANHSSLPTWPIQPRVAGNSSTTQVPATAIQGRSQAARMRWTAVTVTTS